MQVDIDEYPTLMIRLHHYTATAYGARWQRKTHHFVLSAALFSKEVSFLSSAICLLKL